MIKYTKSGSVLRVYSKDYNPDIDYKDCVEDLISSNVVLSMNRYVHHKNMSCFEHCVHVSYISYKICKSLNLDFEAAARGGLLHDLFLYDWHNHDHEGLHGFTHAGIALKNANKYFILSDKEKDIIKKHMWPLNIKLPRYKESAVVIIVDKYCAIAEVFIPHMSRNIERLMGAINNQ